MAPLNLLLGLQQTTLQDLHTSEYANDLKEKKDNYKALPVLTDTI